MFTASGSAVAGEQIKSDKKDTIYNVSDYRFIPESSGDDRDLGHSLCGSRCNALSSNFNNIVEPGGWSMTRTSRNKEILVELNNPFLSGKCLCIADEYSVYIADPGGPRRQRPSAQGK